MTILQDTTSTTSLFTSLDVKTDPLRSVISMDQQSIMMYLSLKGLNAVGIHNDHVATLKGEATPYRTATYYLRKASFSSPQTPQPFGSPVPILNESDAVILLALSDEPFASVRQLGRRTHLNPSRVYDHLTHKLGFPVRCLRSVTHLLSEADKHTRAQLSIELFEILQHQKDRAWHDIVTLDESRTISRQITSGSGFLRELKFRRGSGSPFSREKRW
jgi:hypothetical protein